MDLVEGFKDVLAVDGDDLLEDRLDGPEWHVGEGNAVGGSATPFGRWNVGEELVDVVQESGRGQLARFERLLDRLGHLP